MKISCIEMQRLSGWLSSHNVMRRLTRGLLALHTLTLACLPLVDASVAHRGVRGATVAVWTSTGEAGVGTPECGLCDLIRTSADVPIASLSNAAVVAAPRAEVVRADQAPRVALHEALRARGPPTV